MARTKNEELNKRRRDQILRAAMSCFSSRGFHQTTMQEIVQASEMSAGGIYRYFKSKDDIIVAIAEKESESYRQMADLIRSYDDLRAALKDLLPSIINAYIRIEDARLGTEVLAESTRNPTVEKILTDSETNLFTTLEQAVKDGCRRGQLNIHLPAGDIASFLLASLTGLMTVGARVKSSDSLQASTLEIFDQILGVEPMLQNQPGLRN